MPRYYFHVCDGEGFCEDPEGLTFPNERAALKEAERRAKPLAGSIILGAPTSAFIEVEDGSGKHLFTVTATEVMTILRSGRRAKRHLASA